jgi:glycosyltransferase involved in cell wall biosynthesis
MPKRMSVLHVMWRMSIGGAERAVYQLVREQRERGVDADVAVASEVGLYGERVRETGARVYELGCRGALDVRRSRGLTRLAGEYDIAHHHGVEPLLLAASSRARTPCLVYTHRGGMRDRGVHKRLKLASARPLLRRFAAVSGNTRQSAVVLARILGVSERDVKVVYNGLDFELLTPVRARSEVMAEVPELERKPFVVGTAANLQPWKRVHLLVDAVAQFGEAAHCLILGEGPAKSSLEQQTGTLELHDRVSFLGRKDHVGDYLQLMDVFVLPSGPQEAFGNAAVEAMGVGIPTIVFADGGGLTEHVTDRATGLVVSDTSGLTAALSELASDDALRREIGTRGMEHVRTTYSLEAMFNRYASLYRHALERAA